MFRLARRTERLRCFNVFEFAVPMFYCRVVRLRISVCIFSFAATQRGMCEHSLQFLDLL